MFAMLKARLAGLWKNEPAMVLSVGTAAVIGVAAAVGVTVSNTTAGLIVSLLVPVLLGGAIRLNVVPVGKLRSPLKPKPKP